MNALSYELQAANHHLSIPGDTSGGLRYSVPSPKAPFPFLPRQFPPRRGWSPLTTALIITSMPKNVHENLYAFPAVQEYESVEHALQSLAALRRHLSEPTRASFEHYLRRLQRHLPLYKQVNHLTPIEFVLLGLMIEIMEGKDNPGHPDHPPFP